MECGTVQFHIHRDFRTIAIANGDEAVGYSTFYFLPSEWNIIAIASR
jgi:hypothetical protein